MNFTKTVENVDLSRYLTSWYVIAGRTTFFEKGAHNSIESYHWNEKEQRIDVDFTFNKNSFAGETKSLPQKAWVSDAQTNAHWKVQPMWPLKFNYLIIALDADYEWTAVGVPNGAYLWIMSTSPQMSESKLNRIVQKVQKMGYPVHDIKRVPQEVDVTEQEPKFVPTPDQRSANSHLNINP
jgi:apolipoprotein D and lipocalin family protein